jgi:hypothetical protein
MDPQQELCLAMYAAYTQASQAHGPGYHDVERQIDCPLYVAAKAYVEQQIQSRSYNNAYRSLLLLEFYDRNPYDPSKIPSFPPPPWLNGVKDTPDNQRCGTPPLIDPVIKAEETTAEAPTFESSDLTLHGQQVTCFAAGSSDESSVMWQNVLLPKPDDENDTQNMICRHLRQHYRCKSCSPQSLCNHKRLKSQCHDCEFTFDELSKSRRPQRRKRAKRAPSMTTPVLETIP